MTTSARSGTPPAPCCERARRCDGKEPERAECHLPASLVELRVEGQLDALGAGGEWHRDQAVVPTQARGGPGATRSNRFAWSPPSVRTESRIRRKPGIESALRAPTGAIR